MDVERDHYGTPVDPAARMQQVMLGLYDLMDEALQADFPYELIAELNRVRISFLDEFEQRFPAYGKGRATWR